MQRATRLSLVYLLLGVIQVFASITYAEEYRSTDLSFTSPIRIAREFVRSPLLGKLSIESRNSGLSVALTTASPILWIEYPSSDPEPQPGAISDFRDHLGCAYLSGAEGVAVCFVMMGDVSTLGVNSREMKVSGLPEYFKNSYQIISTCQPDIQNIRFEGASGSEGKIEFSFIADTVNQLECKISPDVLKVQFQMSIAASSNSKNQSGRSPR